MSDEGVEILADWVPPKKWSALAVGEIAPDERASEVAVRLNWFQKRGFRKVGSSNPAVFFATLGALVDQWLASGRQGLEERPYERIVTWFSAPTYPEPIFKTVSEFLKRNPPREIVGTDGRIGLRLGVSLYKKGFLDHEFRDRAILFFMQFLESPLPNKLFRCDRCRLYIVRRDAPRQLIQRGTYCAECKKSSEASVIRMNASRSGHLNKLIELAADWWPKWNSKKRFARSKWIAEMMEPKLPDWRKDDPPTGNWVTRHSKEIEAEVNRRNAHA